MRRAVSAWIVVSVLAFANFAQAADTLSSPSQTPLTTLSKNKVTRAIECHGGDLLVSGSKNVLTATNCPSITISGSGNRMNVSFAGPGEVTASGDDNNVRWTPSPDHLSVRVSSSGRGNELNPVMAAGDLQPFPIGAAGLKSH